ncbi:MAG TPA: hypothetical protein VKC60_17800, partial [Opitutaceae bacterium]|nr:hypothetical protein [Opitutaceae bacterium]
MIDSPSVQKSRLQLTCAAILALVGGSALIGWFGEFYALTQPFQASGPIQIGSALMLVVFAIGLFGIEFGLPKLTLIGVIPVIFGLISITE